MVSVPPRLGVSIVDPAEPCRSTAITTDDALTPQCPFVQCSHPFLKRPCRTGSRLAAVLVGSLRVAPVRVSCPFRVLPRFEIRRKGLFPGTAVVDAVYILMFPATYRVYLGIYTPKLPGAIGRSRRRKVRTRRPGIDTRGVHYVRGRAHREKEQTEI